MLDLADGGAIVISAILDVGCCGWENQSNDQTILTNHGRIVTLFDERAQFKNPDYDVSFFTENAKLVAGQCSCRDDDRGECEVECADSARGAGPGESCGVC